MNCKRTQIRIEIMSKINIIIAELFQYLDDYFDLQHDSSGCKTINIATTRSHLSILKSMFSKCNLD